MAISLSLAALVRWYGWAEMKTPSAVWSKAGRPISSRWSNEGMSLTTSLCDVNERGDRRRGNDIRDESALLANQVQRRDESGYPPPSP